MKRPLVCLVCALLLGCSTLRPFTSRDYAELGAELRPYEARWGPYGYLEVRLTAEREGFVAFVWASSRSETSHAVVLVYFDGHWCVIEEE